MMSFEEYLATKKIDSDQYKVSEPAQWLQFSSIFIQVHPKSFTLQKLNLINSIRRRFPLKVVPVRNEKEPKKTTRPVIKPKTVTSTAVNSGVKPEMASKPKMSKPVVKPKMQNTGESDSTNVTKPKPTMKPKISTAGKPKMVRPVIKPKPKE